MATIELSAGRMHYETAGPQGGRRVVCIHGYMMAASLWRPLSDLLAERGLRCLMPTWPLGAHAEPMRPEAELTMESVAALISEFLAALDLDDVILLGVDTGGAIAQLVATEHPERLGGLVLASCDAFEPLPSTDPEAAHQRRPPERIRVRGRACSAAHARRAQPRLRRARALRHRRPRPRAEHEVDNQERRGDAQREILLLEEGEADRDRQPRL